MRHHLRRRYAHTRGPLRVFRSGADTHVTNGHRTAVVFGAGGGYNAVGYLGADIHTAPASATFSGKSWKTLDGAVRAVSRWVKA